MAEFLRRYTELPFLLHMLSTKKITLLNTGSWSDKNDAYSIEKYREKKDLRAILALCLTSSYETNHHWKTYADNSSGVCISFHKDRLIEQLSAVPGLRLGPAKYLKINEMRNLDFSVDEVPFIKRNAFADEDEFRIIFEKKKDEPVCKIAEKVAGGKLVSKDIPIELTAIADIYFSHNLPDAVYASVKGIVGSMPGCERIRLLRTTLNNNVEWQRNIDRRFDSSASPSM